MAGITACNDVKQYQFELLRKADTGLDFQNTLQQSVDFNALTYMYFFNGGGVSAGDFNNDGKTDLFFTSNMGQNKMFLNEGDLKFRDVTEHAKLEGMGGWNSGTSVVDINNDGLLDIYVSCIGNYGKIKGHNQLYVCQKLEKGVPVFADESENYGLNLVGFGTQASFFDFDRDGDLDMFQLNHSVHENGTFQPRESFQGTAHAEAGDKLMRNDGGKFVEVTREAGILSTAVGYGLGIATSDVNLDGWPDIYIGNDFHENDYLYINQQDGTFKEVLNEQIMHTSKFSMGIDMGDINNDAWADIISLDMLPYDPKILKASMGEDSYSLFHFKLSYGYNFQCARNNLQLNNGDNTFTEIGMFSGIYATDWSWSPLLMDFDHDGYKDLFISNGIPRRLNDMDYINFSRANEELNFKTQAGKLEEKDLAIITTLPQIKLPNKFYSNSGKLKFSELNTTIKNNEPSYSNGAVYADLDNDGDLDIVTNNIEDDPFVYRNMTVENSKSNPSKLRSYLSFTLKGSDNNINGVGARMIVFKGDERIVSENYPVRGFQSSVAPGIHVGVGDTTQIDSVILIWPDQTFEKLDHVHFNADNKLVWHKGLPAFRYDDLKRRVATPFQAKDITAETGIDFVHKENISFVEFNREPLIPYMVSREGPAVAVGDVNGDGLDDIFFGAAKWKQSAVYVQQTDGTFRENTSTTIQNDSTFEDVDALFIDFENDGDQDLIVASGGNEFWGESEFLKQRIYLNDGRGNFSRRFISDEVFVTASCIRAADFNSDGYTDLFVGGRVEPNHHGRMPRSYLLENKGGVKFEDVTERHGREIYEAGMVKDASWSDIDKDGDQDLVVVSEWQPVRVFINKNGQFRKTDLSNKSGWWNFVLPDDLDGDGDIDLIVGNVGTNSKLQPAEEKPVRMYVEDFDGNGQPEQILTYYLSDKEIPFASLAELTRQLPVLKKKFLFSRDFAAASLIDVFEKEKLDRASILTATTFESVYFENTGPGLTFKIHSLPDRLQFSSLKAACSFDLNGDGKKDVITGGNFYECNVEMGRYDGNYGNVISMGTDNKVTVSDLGNLKIRGQVRKIAPVTIRGERCFIIMRNNEPALIIREE
ncbi:MAG TPA: VCBS repeat-containing protein [Ohtaekwangia sp.]